MLTDKIKRDVKNYALHSLYKMNVPSADCYIFYVNNVAGRLDFFGSWDWKVHPVDKTSPYIYDIKQDIFITR